MNCRMSGRLVSVEGRTQAAVTHLASARRLNYRKRHFGFLLRLLKGKFDIQKKSIKVQMRKELL